MLFLFILLAFVLVYFSFRSFLGGVRYFAFFRHELAKSPASFAPFATIIAPCKGVDEGLRDNLTALLHLDYPEYEVIFVVDDDKDPASTVIADIKEDTGSQSSAKSCARIKIVVAERSTDNSQKVENIRAALQHADARSEIFVFVDSDARPQRQWLQHLIAPLAERAVGAATGYRWFISKAPTLASELRSAWNASIASALGPNVKSNFCWGGSMAVRRETWETLDLSHQLKGTLSDDFTVTRAMKAADLEIRFVPQALTPSIENCTFRELFEFTNRQMKITRVYATPLWAISFIGSGLFCAVMTASVLIAMLAPSNSWLVVTAIATIASVAALSIGKAWLRLKAVSLVIPEAYGRAVPQLTLWFPAPFLFLCNCIAALVSRKINWRGIRYELISERQTKRIDVDK